MNERTEQLIRELAEKFGTTAEHLWEVLVYQAFISGLADIFTISAWSFLLVWAIRATYRKSITERAWPEEATVASWTILGIAASTTVLIVGVSIGGIAGKLLNPEYWALQQILP